MISEARTRLFRYGSHAPSGGHRWIFTLQATFLTLAVFGVAAPAGAVEVVVKNDSLAAGQSGNIQAGFVAGESAAAWLTSPCNGNIVAVQVFWRSLLGGEPPSLEDSITIFDEGTFPTPGAQLEQLVGPVLTDSVINEYRFLDENQTIPLIVPVTNAQKFIVSFKFLNTPSPAFGPSVVTDTNGCQNGKNAIFATPGGWLNLCALGASGDLVIRAVVDCNPTQACCFTPAGCLDLTVGDCGIAGGFPHGPGSVCGVTPCFPVGACCNPDGSCDDDVYEDDCIMSGGTYQGHESVCTGVNCPAPDGACCLANQNCLALTQAECLVIPNASWAGALTTCPDACQASAFAPPSTGDDTCQTAAGPGSGTPCSSNANCTISGEVCGLKSRYVSITPTNATVAGTSTSIQVEIVSMPQFPTMVGDIYYAGPEQSILNAPLAALRGAPLQCTPTPNAQVWTSGVLHLFGQAVVPGSTYNVRMCDENGSNCSDPLLVATGKWGDVIRGFGGGSQPNFGDVSAIVAKFGNVASAPNTARTDIVGPQAPGTPNTPNQGTNFADVSNDVSAFSGFAYPYTVSACP